MAGVFALAFWRLVTHRHRESEWVASFCVSRPGLAGLGAALIYLGIECALWRLGTVLAPITGLGMGPIASKWLDWQYVIVQMIIPVVLLIWLGRFRISTQRG